MIKEENLRKNNYKLLLVILKIIPMVTGIVFNRWYADMCYTGVAIDWEDML